MLPFFQFLIKNCVDARQNFLDGITFSLFVQFVYRTDAIHAREDLHPVGNEDDKNNGRHPREDPSRVFPSGGFHHVVKAFNQQLHDPRNAGQNGLTSPGRSPCKESRKDE